MIDVLITFALIVLIGWGCWYLITTLGLPHPADKIATVVLVIVLAIALIFGVLLPALTFVKGRSADRIGLLTGFEQVHGEV